MERSKHFKNYVGLSALLIAGSAAFFSVFGLSKLFAGAAVSVIIKEQQYNLKHNLPHYYIKRIG